MSVVRAVRRVERALRQSSVALSWLLALLALLALLVLPASLAWGARRRRGWAVVSAGLLLIVPASAVGLLTASSAGAASSEGEPLDCTGKTIYAYQRGATPGSDGAILALTGSTIRGATPATVTTTTLTTVPGAGEANALGVSPGGTDAYLVDQAGAGTVKVYGYHAATRTWTTYTGTAGTGNSFVAGAVNPANGVYYYASFASGTATTPGTATLFGFDTGTHTAIPGVIATFDLPVQSRLGFNGDIAFDAAGNLYVLTSAGTSARLGVVDGPIPVTGSATGVVLPGRVLSTVDDPNARAYNGIAFDNAGHLYLGFTGGTATHILEVDPNTGATIAGPKAYTGGDTSAVDLAACSTPPTLSLRTNVVDRFVGSTGANDQFGLAITGGGVTNGNTATTTGAAKGMQAAGAGPVLAVEGTAYTLTETAAAGSLDDYATSYDCVDTANGGSSVASGHGASFALLFPPTVEGRNSPAVVCTFANTPQPPTPALTVTKSVDTRELTAAGQVLHYSFVVTNSGNVTLTNVAVTDTAFPDSVFSHSASSDSAHSGSAHSGSAHSDSVHSGDAMPPGITCPAAAVSLARGASVTCTASYSVTRADLDGGKLTHTATATGTAPSGAVVGSAPSTVVVGTVAGPTHEPTRRPTHRPSHEPDRADPAVLSSVDPPSSGAGHGSGHGAGHGPGSGSRPSAHDPLASTGAHAAWFVGTAVALLTLGGGLLLITRRHRDGDGAEG